MRVFVHIQKSMRGVREAFFPQVAGELNPAGVMKLAETLEKSSTQLQRRQRQQRGPSVSERSLRFVTPTSRFQAKMTNQEGFASV